MPQSRVLIIDRDLSLCQQLQARLMAGGHSVVCRTHAGPGPMDGFDVLVSRVDVEEPVCPLAISGARTGLEAVLVAPYDLEFMAIAVSSSIARGELQPSTGDDGNGLLGRSAAMVAARETLRKLAETMASVVITGETGTGKEVAAHLLHAQSRRSSGPFVAINCAAMPETLLESELFGHARGAFTDAHDRRSGLLLHANGGTLFLDEVAELPLALQPRLLRALQERTVRPLGSNTEVPFDVRLITATHRDLAIEVAEGRFREDLFYRLDVVRLELPRLRDRGADVSLLAHHFLRHFARHSGKGVVGFAPEALALLTEYAWPGNVRELQNSVQRAVALVGGAYVMPDDLPARLRDKPFADTAKPDSRDNGELLPLHELERRHILRVLEAVSGNKSAAAQILQVDRRTLYRKLERLEPHARASGRPIMLAKR